MIQMLDQGVLNPDAHMFAQQDFYQSEPDFVADIMTQISLKVGLREWGYKSQTSATLEMKQLPFRKTFTPMNWKQINHDQCLKVLNLHMYLKKKLLDGKIKGQTVAGEKNNDYIFQRRMQVRQMYPPKMYYCHASSMRRRTGVFPLLTFRTRSFRRE